MKVFKSCFCLFLLSSVLFVTDTFAMIDFLSGFWQDIFPMCSRNPPQTETRIAEGPAKSLTPAKLHLFNQKLDHFNATDTRYFNQRYFVNEVDYVKGNPVFLLVGGLSELIPRKLEEGIWYDLAKEMGALILAVEYRMFGKSYPSGDWDFSTPNLVYLNSEQALADLGFFMDEIVLKKMYGIQSNSKWIALGSSYGGTLAALVRLKYPHIVTASVAIDAPLLPILAFEGFYNVVEAQCKIERIENTIIEAFTDLKSIFSSCEDNEQDGEKNVKCVEEKLYVHREIFNFCEGGLSTNYDLKNHKNFLFWSLTKILARALQFGNENERKVVSNILKNERDIPKALDRLGEAVKLVLNNYNIECFVVNYKSLVDSYRDTSPTAENELNYLLHTGLGNRQILFQSCTERGQFETSNKKSGIFANLIPLEFYVFLCLHVFGSQYNTEYLEDAVGRTEMFYGGQDINVSNVLFIISGNNFWAELGFLERKAWNQVTEENGAVLLKAEDLANGSDKWNYIINKLKSWSRVSK